MRVRHKVFNKDYIGESLRICEGGESFFAGDINILNYEPWKTEIIFNSLKGVIL